MLSPYRVIDLTDHRGELAPMLLGDMGADVIRIEAAGGSSARREGTLLGEMVSEDLRSLQFLAFNRNKRSIVVDDHETDVLHALLASADFVIASGPDGEMARRGIDFDLLRALNPRVICVVISPWGLDGPAAGRPGNDLTLSAMGGQAALQGSPDRAPVRISVPQLWRHAGAEAATAAMIAHARMKVTGEAQFADLSAQCVTTWTTMNAMDAAAVQGFDFERQGSVVNMGTRVVDPVLPCADGHVVVLPVGPVIEPLLGHLLGEEIVDPSWLEEDWQTIDQRRLDGEDVQFTREDQIEALVKFFATRTKKDLFKLSLEIGVTIAPVNTTADLLEFEQLQVRAAWETTTLPGRQEVRLPGRVALSTVTSLDTRRRAPGLNEHGAELRAEIAGEGRAPASVTIAQNATGRPFEGLKVLDLTWIIAGPSTVRYFADHGATVVKVESQLRPDGLRMLGPQSGDDFWNASHFHGEFNAGKHCIQLNLKHPDAIAVMKKLIAWADVFVENWAPGALGRAGLDYAVAKEINPRLIMCSTSLMGQSGPASTVAGYGYHAGGMAGYYEVTGWPDMPPHGPWMAYTDVIAPRIIVALVTAALDHRERTGEGQHIDAAQFEMALQFLAPEIIESQTHGTVVSRIGNRSRFAAPQGIYPAAGEDQWVAIAVDADAQWRSLVDVIDIEGLDDPAFATNAGRLAHHDRLDELLSTWTRDRDRYEVMERLTTVGVPAGALQRSSDHNQDPQYLHRQFQRYLEHPVQGRVPYAGVQYIIPGYTPGPYRHAPLLGEHTDQVLSEELGMSDAEIAAAREAGALE